MGFGLLTIEGRFYVHFPVTLLKWTNPSQVYQNRKSIDADVKELLETMRDSLKFVESTTTFENVLSQSEDTVAKLLRTLYRSSQHIREYLDATEIGEGRLIFTTHLVYL